MPRLKASLTSIIDNGFPVLGTIEFKEVSGETVVILEKLPVIGAEFLEGETDLPFDIELDCTLVSTSNEVVVIDTKEPFSVADIQGRTKFRVDPNLLVE
ncbi:hypothetical protein J7443_03505 [Tropicibacter sp. R15_0]|uniref:hypothetical protein n=1 Tax=Tropicibacter sp. R15_0 TaxID=2821101 RepID=UPI001ADC3DD0|nr:hypothetical protein [Tropicibacter sp. R15_0]MBO9464284.1 hypothetical protein [Tropicibacter sp. R15_0]